MFEYNHGKLAGGPLVGTGEQAADPNDHVDKSTAQAERVPTSKYSKKRTTIRQLFHELAAVFQIEPRPSSPSTFKLSIVHAID